MLVREMKTSQEMKPEPRRSSATKKQINRKSAEFVEPDKKNSRSRNGSGLEDDAKFASIVFETNTSPSGDIVFASIDAAGSPGRLNSRILQQLKLSEGSLPKPAMLADGFAITNGPSGGLLCFIVTVGDQETEIALRQNLLACLKALGKLVGKTMWLPLMGTGDGGLSYEMSLKSILDAFEQSGLIFDEAIWITIAVSGEVSPSELNRLREMARKFTNDLKPFSDLRDAANMQDDRPTETDMLGRTQYAKALATRINRMMGWGRPSDRTSLMIQLHAPWGAGKTSFMRLLEVSLKELPESRWTIVWFNAWENQRISAPWWMLYERIFSTLSARNAKSEIPWRRRAYLQVNEFVWRLTVGNWANLAFVGIGLGLLGVAVFMEQLLPHKSADVIAYLKGIAAIVGVLSTAGGLVRTALGNLLGGGSKAAQGFVDMAQDPITKLRTHYEHLLADSGRQIMIFIDDLDRCGSDYVVKLLEGIQTMFAHPDVVWLIASDRRWLADAFEASYGSDRKIAEPGNRLGYQFLEKAFQLMIALPQISDNDKDRYWRSMIGGSTPGKAAGEQRVDEAATVQAAEEKLAVLKTEGEVLQVLQEYTNLSPRGSERLRRLAVARMAADDIDRSVEHLLAPFSRVLKSNPRAMKRLLNSYTVFRDLALLGNLLENWETGQRQELARWAILCMDLPVLLDLLEERPILLETNRGRLLSWTTRRYALSGSSGVPKICFMGSQVSESNLAPCDRRSCSNSRLCGVSGSKDWQRPYITRRTGLHGVIAQEAGSGQ